MVLLESCKAEVEAILARFPAGQERSALVPLLFLAQKHYGVITKDAIAEVSALAGMDPIRVAELTGFYTLIMDQPHGKRRVQICTDLPCALRGSEEFARDVCDNLGIQLGETTPDGEFTVEAVSCLAGCGKAPVFQVQDSEGLHYYESETPDQPLQAAHAVKILKTLQKD